MDYSRSSIEYARAHSTGVKYILGNYLEMQFEDEFDVAFMIYCDFGALIDQQRDNLLHRVHRALTPGALFVFDVWTHEARKTRPHKSWTLKDGGFWSAKPYISLTETFCYPENDVYLDQHIVVADAEEARVYRVWDHVYSPDSIERVLCSNGFRVIELWEDLTGNPYDEHSRSIAVIAQVCKDFC
jgi:SAM-dependent methyltransferase